MLNEVVEIINQANFSAGASLEERENGQNVIFVSSDQIFSVCETLYNNSKYPFKTLMVITGCDYEDRIEVSYILATFDPNNNHEIILKTKVPRDNPILDSVCDIWKSADWQERECFDMLGVKFNNHPDLKRILCCYDWEGHPLRKDYQAAKEYHGIEIYPEDKMNNPEREFVSIQKENPDATRPELNWE